MACVAEKLRRQVRHQHQNSHHTQHSLHEKPLHATHLLRQARSRASAQLPTRLNTTTPRFGLIHTPLQGPSTLKDVAVWKRIFLPEPQRMTSAWRWTSREREDSWWMIKLDARQASKVQHTSHRKSNISRGRNSSKRNPARRDPTPVKPAVEVRKDWTKIRMITVPAHLLHRVLTTRDIPRDHVHPVTLIVSNASRNGGSKRPTSESQYGEKHPLPKILPATPLPKPPQSAERTRRNDRLTHPTRRNCTANRFSRCRCCAWLKLLEEGARDSILESSTNQKTTEASSADLDHL